MKKELPEDEIIEFVTFDSDDNELKLGVRVRYDFDDWDDNGNVHVFSSPVEGWVVSPKGYEMTSEEIINCFLNQ